MEEANISKSSPFDNSQDAFNKSRIDEEPISKNPESDPFQSSK
jgi:hypothetical protein